ncbi:MAG: hypothetical protein ABI748_12990, partial [Dokdonella sp.]
MLLVLTAIYVILDIPLEATDLFRNSPVVSHYGFAVARNAHGALPVTQLYPSAERAGLHVDDVVIGLGDARLSPGATRFDLAAQLDALNSAPATLLLLDRTGSVRTLVLTPQAQGLGLIHLFYGMPIWAFGIVQLLALSIPLFVLLCASFLLYKKRPSDGEAMMLAFSFLALIFSTSSGSWPFLYARLPDVVSDVAVQLGTALLCIAVAGVPDGRFTSLWARMAVFAAVIYGLAGVLLALRSDNLHFAALQALLQYAAIGLAAVAIVVRYRASAQIARQQIKWVAIGAVVTVLAMATSIALSFWGIDAAMAPGLRQVVLLFLFVVVHIAIPIGMAISVLAYRLFDSEALITRSAAYAALSVSVIGVFAASESVVQSFGA